MKKLVLLLFVGSALIFTSCGTESCACHTFGAIQKPVKKTSTTVSASIENPKKQDQ